MSGAKKWLVVLSVLAIITCMSAGTLAIYTTQIDSAMQTEVTAKRFVLTADTSILSDINVKLAPLDLREYKRGEDVPFTVSNYEVTKDGRKIPSEVPIVVTFDVLLDGQLFYNVKGTEVKLVDADHANALDIKDKGKPSWITGYKPVFGQPRKVEKVLYKKSDYVVLDAGKPVDRHFYLRFQWAGDINPNAGETKAGQEQYKGSVQLKITGTQQVSKSN